ncbi:MAG: dihydropteroate synthase [bacterium]|jgi:dihydropteroate synthase
MPSSDIHFLLHSIEASLASDFLNRTYQIQKSFSDQCPISVFVWYFRPQEHTHYRSFIDELEKNFPTKIFLQKNTPLGNRFIVATSIIEFFRIFHYIPDGKLKQMIECCLKKPNSNLKIGSQVWKNDRPRIMGILNITPDSFYDGGVFYEQSNFVEIVRKMIDQGVGIIDIGGESTRPGSKQVSVDEEIRRILPVLQQIRSEFQIPISIDTTKAEVADIALQHGANLINDTSGLKDGSKMLSVLKKHHASYCLMHIQGTPDTMQNNPEYSDIIAEIILFFQEKLKLCQDYGLGSEQLMLDPGIGFGKTVEQNLDLIRFISTFDQFKSLILLGTSNKSFLGKILNREVSQRNFGSLSSQVLGFGKGANIFRVHDVLSNYDALQFASVFYLG